MSETLRIVFYTDSFLPAVDGVVTSILAFKKELENRGNQVHIVAVGNSETKNLVKQNKDITIVRGVKFNRYPQYIFSLTPFTASFKVRKFNPDILHLQTPFTVGLYGLMSSKINNYPVIGSFHTLFNKKEIIEEYLTSNEQMKNFLIKYSWKYLKYFYNKCDATVVPSESIKKYLAAKSIKNINVIPNGIDIRRFNPSKYSQSLRNNLLGKRGDDTNIVLYLGRLSREKNVDVLINAASYLKNDKIKFVIGGTGPLLDKYKEMVNNKGLGEKFKFVGFVKETDLPNYYASADVVCLPSTFETQGIVSLEALASGTPVVGADYLALKNLITNGKNGELFKPMSAKDCALKIKKVINNKSSYKEPEKTAREYSIEKMTDKLLNLYTSTLNEEK